MPEILSPSFIAIADFVLKSFLVLLAAFTADFIFRKANANIRHTLWMAALIVVMLLPFISNSLPKLDLPVLSFLGFDLGGAAANADLPAASGAADLPEDNEFLSPGFLLTLGFYVIGVVIVAIWQFVGRAYAGNLKKKSKELDNSDLRRIRAQLADELQMDNLPSVMSNSLIKIPFTTGLFNPVIILPEEAKHWPRPLLRSVLAHEMAHIKRKDLISRAVGQLSCCINWFNPLAWFGLQNVLVEQEFACDNHVINTGAKPSEYAENLLEVANIRGSKLDHALASMGRKEGLKGRIVEILTPTRKSDGKARTQMVVLLVILGALFIPAILLNPWASRADEDLESKKEAVTAEKKALEKSEADLQKKKDKEKVDLEQEAKLYFNKVSSLIASGQKISVEKAKSIITQMRIWDKKTKVITPKVVDKFTTALKKLISTKVPKSTPPPDKILTKEEYEKLVKAGKIKPGEFMIVKKKEENGRVKTKKETILEKEKQMKEEALKKADLEKKSKIKESQK